MPNYVVVYKGYGKRIKRGKYMRPLSLYGTKFIPHARVVLTEDFKHEAGLDGNEQTEGAILLSLKTDYGIHVIKRVAADTDTTPKPEFSEPEATTPPQSEEEDVLVDAIDEFEEEEEKVEE